MVNRSGKEAVKEYLAAINAVCDEQEERTEALALSPPIEKCMVLSYWSTDAYYAIVMYKNGGVETVVRVMRTFLEVSDSDVEDFCEANQAGYRPHKVHSNASRFQACCARILLGLCSVSPRLKQAVVAAGGRDIALAAIQKYPRSFDVESMNTLLEHEVEDADKPSQKDRSRPS